MTLHAEYKIKLKNLRPDGSGGATSNADHDIIRHIRIMGIPTGRIELRGILRAPYNLARGFIRRNDGRPYGDMDFFINKKRSTELEFKISQNGWEFANPAITIPGMTSAELALVSKKKKATIKFPGSDVFGSEGEFKYTLHYLHNKKPLKHDPIISNGSTQPFQIAQLLGLLFFTVFTTSILATAFVSMLIKFNYLQIQ